MLQHRQLDLCKSKDEKERKFIMVTLGYKQRGKKYIYSVERANELIQYGCRCIETGFNAKQQRFYWTFNYDEVQPFYEERNKANN